MQEIVTVNTSNFIELALFFLLTLLAEILGTIGGFGSSLFFVPLGQFFFDFQTVLALTGLLHVFSNTSKIYLFRKTIDWKIVLWLGVTSILFAIVGAVLTKVVDFQYTSLILGLFLICFSVFFLINPKFSINPTKQNSVVSGGIAGFLAGFIGTGGAIRGLVLASFNLEKNFFVGTSAMIDFGVDISRTVIYLKQHYLQYDMLWYIPMLLIAAFAGSYLGKLFLKWIKHETFKKIMLGLIFVTGISLLIEHLIP